MKKHERAAARLRDYQVSALRHVLRRFFIEICRRYGTVGNGNGGRRTEDQICRAISNVVWGNVSMSRVRTRSNFTALKSDSIVVYIHGLKFDFELYDADFSMMPAGTKNPLEYKVWRNSNQRPIALVRFVKLERNPDFELEILAFEDRQTD